jgi:hypothetical protein
MESAASVRFPLRVPNYPTANPFELPMRGFRNAGKEPALLMAILGGTDAGHVSWAPKVLEQARATGLKLDEQGNLIQ